MCVCVCVCVNVILTFIITISQIDINNLREKFSPGQGLEPGWRPGFECWPRREFFS